METKVLWAVTTNTDLTEGRGREVDVGYVHDKSLAAAIVTDKRYSRFCCMGVQSARDTEYKVSRRQFTIYSSVDEFFAEHDTVARLKAITDKIGEKDMAFLRNHLLR